MSPIFPTDIPSVEMIRKHYAANIKELVDTAQINVMRPRQVRQLEEPTISPTTAASIADMERGIGGGWPIVAEMRRRR